MLINIKAEATGLLSGGISALGMGTPSCIDPKTGLLVNANDLILKRYCCGNRITLTVKLRRQG